MDAMTAAALVAAANGLTKLWDRFHKRLPAGEERDELSRAIEEATRTFKVAEAKTAEELGFRICHCDFPPGIMIKDGEEWVCRKCQKREPLMPPPPKRRGESITDAMKRRGPR